MSRRSTGNTNRGVSGNAAGPARLSQQERLLFPLPQQPPSPLAYPFGTSANCPSGVPQASFTAEMAAIECAGGGLFAKTLRAGASSGQQCWLVRR